METGLVGWAAAQRAAGVTMNEETTVVAENVVVTFYDMS